MGLRHHRGDGGRPREGVRPLGRGPGHLTDWAGWHRGYDDPTSYLSRRLAVVQARIGEAFDQKPPGRVRVVSMCAGEGRDLLGALRGHPRRDDVRARLVELDERNAAAAQAAAQADELDQVEVRVGDAGVTDAYAGAVPAELVLVCGVFGNITDDDIGRTIENLPQLCAPGATVIWTRHRHPPDATPWIRRRFADEGFVELSFDSPDPAGFGVGVHRLDADPAPLEPGVRFFRFAI